VTITDYGIAKPQYLGVGVKNQVQVRVSLAATPVAAPSALVTKTFLAQLHLHP
jgi:hypothetical protein